MDRIPYNSTIKSQRSLRHGQIARAIEQIDPDTVSVHPELLAHHLQAAGDRGAALKYWLLAGDQAARHSASVDAAAHYQAALWLLPAGRTDQEAAAIELDLQFKLGAALFVTEGYASQRMCNCYARARELAADLAEIDQYVIASSRLGMALNWAGRCSAAVALVEQMTPEDLERLQPASRIARWLTLGTAQGHLGALDEALANLDKAREVLRHVPVQYRRQSGGMDPLMLVLATHNQVLTLRGLLSSSESDAQRLTELADREGQAIDNAFALAQLAWNGYFLRRDVVGALNAARRAFEMATESNFKPIIAMAALGMGSGLILTGEIAEGAKVLREGYSLHQLSGSKAHRVMFACIGGQSWMEAGYAEEADDHVRAGEAAQGEAEERRFDAELLRLRGRLFEISGDFASAESRYRRGVEIAEIQSAKLFSLRAATDLASLLRKDGRADEGKAILKPICDWFTEGFDYPDLVRARTALGSRE